MKFHHYWSPARNIILAFLKISAVGSLEKILPKPIWAESLTHTREIDREFLPMLICNNSCAM